MHYISAWSLFSSLLIYVQTDFRSVFSLWCKDFAVSCCFGVGCLWACVWPVRWNTAPLDAACERLKGQFTWKWKYCHLLILKYLQTCMNVFVLNTREDILKNVRHRAVFLFLTVEVNGDPKQPDYKLSSEYLPLCSAEQTHSHRSGDTWVWVNDDRSFIFRWTVSLRWWSARALLPRASVRPLTSV